MKKLGQTGFSVVEGILIFVIVGVIGGVGWYVWSVRDDSSQQDNSAITTFEDCVEAGNPIFKSEPPQCETNGQSFTKGFATDE